MIGRQKKRNKPRSILLLSILQFSVSQAFTLYPSSTTHRDNMCATDWRHRPALLWDPVMAANATSSYWKHHKFYSTLSSDEDSKSTSDNRQTSELLCLTYGELFRLSALLVHELRKTLRSLQSAREDQKCEIPVVVAIPEGPYLPLAVLVVHALNREFDGAEANQGSVSAILVPLEPSEAKERNRHILQDIQPRLILAVPGADMDHLQGLVADTSNLECTIVDLVHLVTTTVALSSKEESPMDFPEGESIFECQCRDTVAKAADTLSNIDHPTSQRNQISHIVYTSGTTGLPKGCVSSIESLQHYMQVKNEIYSIDRSSTVFLASSLSFDPCLSDILATFQAGATLAIAPRRMIVGNISTILQNLRASHVLCTPTLWGMVDATPEDFVHLKVVALGGERIPKYIAQKWAKPDQAVDVDRPRCRLFATYGVTEACVYQSASEITVSRMASSEKGQFVGPAFPGLQFRTCKEDNQESLENVPDGEPGEIVVSGLQVDHLTGYWRRPELDYKFVQTTELDGTRRYHYRTGDRGFLDSTDGSLIIRGRIQGEEGMVKVNGARVELGEIENAIVDKVGQTYGDAPSPPILVDACLATVVDVSAIAEERKEIHAYCVLSKIALKELGFEELNRLPQEGLLITGGTLLTLLRARCENRIKTACIPSVFVIVPSIPLSPTGKSDRRGLPLISDCSPFNDQELQGIPLGEFGSLGKFLATEITKCLNLQPLQQKILTTEATFDMIGGDSLAATRIIRALYAYHNQISNSRFLGGGFGKFDGAFDVTKLLRAQNLGAYVNFLVDHGVGGHVCSTDHGEIAEEDMGARTRSTKAPTATPEGLKDQNLYDCLLKAATLGNSAIAIGLLQAGTNPNFGNHGKRLGKVRGGFYKRKSTFHSSPLHLACMRGDDVLVQHLLRKGATCRSPDASSLYPLHLAASAAKSGRKVDDQADFTRRLNCVRCLVEAGCPIKMRDGNRQTVLHAAARAGQASILTYVINRLNQSGVESLTTKPDKRYVNWLDRWYRTPVHWAILNGHVETLETALEMGCSPTPLKPNRVKQTSVIVESPIELCDRLYPEDSDDSEKVEKGRTIRKLLQGRSDG